MGGQGGGGGGFGVEDIERVGADLAGIQRGAHGGFVDQSGARPEVWTYGLRNPWRLTYDATSGQLWAGENGQDAWEFAHLVRRGANYGWAAFEGSHRYHAGRPLGPTPVSPPTENPHRPAAIATAEPWLEPPVMRGSRKRSATSTSA